MRPGGAAGGRRQVSGPPPLGYGPPPEHSVLPADLGDNLHCRLCGEALTVELVRHARRYLGCRNDLRLRDELDRHRRYRPQGCADPDGDARDR